MPFVSQDREDGARDTGSPPLWHHPGLRAVDGRLRIAGRDAEELAREHGTPLFVYDLERVDETVRALRDALAAGHDFPGLHAWQVRVAFPILEHLQAGLPVGIVGGLGGSVELGLRLVLGQELGQIVLGRIAAPGSTTPFPMVVATLVSKKNAAMKLKNAAQRTA